MAGRLWESSRESADASAPERGGLHETASAPGLQEQRKVLTKQYQPCTLGSCFRVSVHPLKHLGPSRGHLVIGALHSTEDSATQNTISRAVPQPGPREDAAWLRGAMTNHCRENWAGSGPTLALGISGTLNWLPTQSRPNPSLAIHHSGSHGPWAVESEHSQVS